MQKDLIEMGITYSLAVNAVYARCQVRGMVPADLKQVPQTSPVGMDIQSLTNHLLETVSVLGYNLTVLLDFVSPLDQSVVPEVARILSSRHRDEQPLPMTSVA